MPPSPPPPSPPPPSRPPPFPPPPSPPPPSPPPPYRPPPSRPPPCPPPPCPTCFEAHGRTHVSALSSGAQHGAPSHAIGRHEEARGHSLGRWQGSQWQRRQQRPLRGRRRGATAWGDCTLLALCRGAQHGAPSRAIRKREGLRRVVVKMARQSEAVAAACGAAGAANRSRDESQTRPRVRRRHPTCPPRRVGWARADSVLKS